MEIHGKLVDIHTREIYPAVIEGKEGKITRIERDGHRGKHFILPGFIDAHIHIESTLLPPSEFARLAVRHGTIATVSDPHPMANVLGISGVEYMIDNGKKVPFKFYFGAPPCVPTTKYETSGATLGVAEVRELLEQPDIKYLSEVLDFYGVIHEDSKILEKIQIAKNLGKPVDGHAPGLFGENLKKYYNAGIQTDHESTTLSEAREKLSLGMKILIREGSAAKNFNTLFPLLLENPLNCMLCTDDLHPYDLMLGHLNLLVRRAVQKGMDPIDILLAVSKNPVQHYGLDVGLLRVGDPADFILVEDLTSFRVLETYIGGVCVFKEECLIPRIEVSLINKFEQNFKQPKDFVIPSKEGEVHVIKLIQDQILTQSLKMLPKIEKGQVVSDLQRDILKIAVINRYQNAPPAMGLIQNFGLKKGAIASSIAHNSHNIIAVGVTDEELCAAVNALMDAKGGIALSHKGKTDILPLPIAGLMSSLEGEEVAVRYSNMNEAAKDLGSALKAPFMTLSFMALLDTPELKISDKGLFDSKHFQLINLYI